MITSIGDVSKTVKKLESQVRSKECKIDIRKYKEKEIKNSIIVPKSMSKSIRLYNSPMGTVLCFSMKWAKSGKRYIDKLNAINLTRKTN